MKHHPLPFAPAAVALAAAAVVTLAPARARAADDGLPLFYTAAGGGAGYVNLTGFTQSQLALPTTDGAAGVFDLGAGLNLGGLGLGGRARYLGASAFNLWMLDGEVSFHGASRPFDPFLDLRGGYTFSGSVDTSQLSTPSAAVQGLKLTGFNLGIDLGEDYYILPILSLGMVVGFDALFLQRDALSPTASGLSLPNTSLLTSGSASGYAVTGALRLGLHL